MPIKFAYVVGALTSFLMVIFTNLLAGSPYPLWQAIIFGIIAAITSQSIAWVVREMFNIS